VTQESNPLTVQRAPDRSLMRFAGPVLRAVAGRRVRKLANEDPVAAQEAVLAAMVKRAAATKFGRDHDFASIKTVADYQRQVPLRRYDDFWREYWQPSFPEARDCTWPGLAPFYAMSSGTSTGVNKYIPTTRELIHSNMLMMRDVMAHHSANRPGTRALRGKVMMLGGSTALTREAPGVQSGDLSGIELVEIGWPMRRWFFPPLHLAAIPDYETKIDALAKAALTEDIRVIIGPPNWLMVFFDRLLALKPGATRLVEVFPNLEVLVHGGMAFAPYRPRFQRLLEGSHAEFREIYAASEGFFAVADRGNGEGLRMVVDSGFFYEFIPMAELGSANPTRHWLGNAETGVEYALAISNPAGAWSYLIGDTVRLIDKRPARLLVTGRTSYVLTPFGEHIIHDQLEDALQLAARETGLEIAEYSVGPEFASSGAVAGRHLYIIEFVGALPAPATLDRFSKVVDERLISLNEDYARRRARDINLYGPQILAVPRGTCIEWLRSRGRIGGQIKVPRVLNDRALFDSLEALASASGGVRSGASLQQRVAETK
jgi:hypothetical protein